MAKILLEKEYINNAKSNEMKIITLSDIHDDGKIKRLEFYRNILKIIENVNPNYICIPGDIVEEEKTKLENIESFIKSLGTIAPTILSLGNHELVLDKEEREKIFDWFMNLEKYSNIHPLNNSVYETEDTCFVGLTSRLENYKQSFKYAWNDMFIKDYHNIKTNLNEEKYNVLLCHNPYTINPQLMHLEPELNKYNLILSGHMHNGCTPDFIANILDLYPLTKGRGILSPYFRILSSHCRGLEKVNSQTYLHINKGLRKFTKNNPFWESLDIFYNKHIHELNITHTEEKEYINKYKIR